jgi:hypothetical protein
LRRFCPQAQASSVSRCHRGMGPTGTAFVPLIWSHEGRAHAETERVMDYCSSLLARRAGGSKRDVLRRWKADVGAALAIRRARMAQRCLPRADARTDFTDVPDGGPLGVTSAAMRVVRMTRWKYRALRRTMAWRISSRATRTSPRPARGGCRGGSRASASSRNAGHMQPFWTRIEWRCQQLAPMVHGAYLRPPGLGW